MQSEQNKDVSEGLWIQNTRTTPFFKNKGAIEVRLHTGEVKTLSCAPCAMTLFNKVKEWRKKIND